MRSKTIKIGISAGKEEKMTYYSCSEIDRLVSAYCEKEDGFCDVLAEGVLGYGLMVLSAPGFKFCVVKEVPLNEWSSGHTIRFYNVLPKVYERMLSQ